MVVQHNLTAMNSNRMLGLTTAAQAKSTEKLSSGYKINRAADDAAGLAISEKMRKQIRGLTQASANAQDGISAVQTAEGALTEVHDMLQRMNELAVKAANGTNSESDRQAIQSEIDQLVTEIDRVAETTKFNETYLLKGDKNVSKQYSYSYGAVGTSVAATAAMDTDAATGLTVGITFTEGASAADQNAIAKALRDQGVTVASEATTDEEGNTTTKYSVTLNGAAASSYNVNAIDDSNFEIVDLEGNQIATLTASTTEVQTGATDETEEQGTMTWAKDAATADIYALTAADEADGITNATKIDDTNFVNYFDVDAEGNVAVKEGVTIYDAVDTTDGGTNEIDPLNTDDYVAGEAAVEDTATASAGVVKQSAIITASSITAAQNQGDVAQFYDDDGNAISGNSLGNYFSVLSANTNAVDETEEQGTMTWAKDAATADIYALTAADEVDGITNATKIDDTNFVNYFDVDAEGNVTVKEGVTIYDAVDTTDGGTNEIDPLNTDDYVAGEAAVEDTAAAAAEVAAQAGAQLYDAVGNNIDMTEAAQSVAANKNLTGALNLRLHVGADATSNNQISLNIEAMSAKGLGINGLKVDGTDDTSALSAIETIKEAIQKVSAQRSDLGAVQNRLEHTINNLDNVVENTTSAESQIRDTDMATEMVQYSNQNILAQAGQAMLAQANQSNQGVLSLLG